MRFGTQNFNWLVLFGSGRTVKHYFGRSLVRSSSFWRNNFCTQLVPPRFKLGIFMYWTCNSMNNLSSYFVLVDAKEKTFWQGFTCINSISNPRVSVWGVVSLGGHFACICRGFNFYDVKKQNLICLSSLSWIFAGYTGSKNKILQTWFFKTQVQGLLALCEFHYCGFSKLLLRFG